MRFKTAFIIMALCARLAYAGEEGGEGAEGEHKAKPPEKPRPDSAISVVLQLPVVKEWGKWIASKNNDSYLAVWGESIKTVEEHECWGVVVGESIADGSMRVWRRFCVSQTGLDLWVENRPDKPTDEVHYYTYDDWVKKCKPTNNSSGTC